IAAALALGAQLVLPAAHEWQVARIEASHPHEAIQAGASRLSPKGAPRHHHHDEGSCAVSSALARLADVLGPAARASASRSPALQRVPAAPDSPLVAHLVGSFSPRAPPAA
ncbi:MAG TPA: hypothetical protein VNI01_01910, partial [Elusimicrobiota bacterium]|nr:hypothetical protein [Elusimicrobiota bacterium]